MTDEPLGEEQDLRVKALEGQIIIVLRCEKNV